MTIQNYTGDSVSALELAVMGGDLSKLTGEQRIEYLRHICRTTGLNPATSPFQYITFRRGGALTLYLTRGGAMQLAALHKVSLRALDEREVEGVYIVKVEASTPDGRVVYGEGANSLFETKFDKAGKPDGEQRLGGAALANKIMATHTKARRRATMDICGLGYLDESETDTLPDAQRVQVHPSTGEIVGRETGGQLTSGDRPQGVRPTGAPAAAPELTEDDRVERLQRWLAGKDMPWATFEALVLHMPWAEYARMGGNAQKALEAYNAYIAATEPAADTSDQDDVSF